jgi:hypothetical protein
MDGGDADVGNQRERSLIEPLSPALLSNEHTDLMSVSGLGARHRSVLFASGPRGLAVFFAVLSKTKESVRFMIFLGVSFKNK